LDFWGSLAEARRTSERKQSTRATIAVSIQISVVGGVRLPRLTGSLPSSASPQTSSEVRFAAANPRRERAQSGTNEEQRRGLRDDICGIPLDDVRDGISHETRFARSRGICNDLILSFCRFEHTHNVRSGTKHTAWRLG
jgi:hypothetical protein